MIRRMNADRRLPLGAGQSLSADLLLAKASAAGLDDILEALDSTSGVRTYILAGAVRDVLLSVSGRASVSTKDFDVVVEGMRANDLCDIGLLFNGVENRYGGYRIRLASGMCVDLWRLEDTLGVRIGRQEANIYNVLRSFVLNTNAVACDLQSRTILDLGASSSIEKRTIDVLPDAILHSEASFSSRAILLALRLSFRTSDRLEDFVRCNFDPPAHAYELAKLPPVWSASFSGYSFSSAALAGMSKYQLLDVVADAACQPRLMGAACVFPC